MAEPSTTAELLTHLDRLLHEPARLLVVSHLYVVDSADFVFLLRQTGLTQGNLSSHLTKLENADYISIEKTFVGKRPKTILRLTARGKSAFEDYARRMRPVLGIAPD